MIETHGTVTLMPPHKGLCQTCGSDHEPELPHNAHSMYYQVAFKMQNGRAPDWRDALEHCSSEMRATWVKGLADAGVDVEAGQVYPARARRK